MQHMISCLTPFCWSLKILTKLNKVMERATTRKTGQDILTLRLRLLIVATVKMEALHSTKGPVNMYQTR